MDAAFGLMMAACDKIVAEQLLLLILKLSNDRDVDHCIEKYLTKVENGKMHNSPNYIKLRSEVARILNESYSRGELLVILDDIVNSYIE